MSTLMYGEEFSYPANSHAYHFNYGIFLRKAKKGMVPYVLQWDLHSSCMFFARRGMVKLKYKIPFYKLLKVTTGSSHPHLFTLEICNTDSYLDHPIHTEQLSDDTLN